ncbi:MAG: hypothetical protein A2X64_11355 [Ignavibacteria bacterium GWF2_33_9]|nr:MAG: hypothetical protein A2X64_11355 [Ignavibacteria bacterium GWF2_33_9]
MTELKIAIRYIFSKHSFNFISIINFLSLIGIMIGVAALIVVLSIFNAFQDIAIKQIVGFDPHIKVDKVNELKNFDYWLNKNVHDDLIENKAIVSESRIICFKGAVSRTANLQAVEPNNENLFAPFDKNMIMGGVKFNGNPAITNVLIGVGIADALHVMVGDTLFITSPQEIENSLLSMSVPSSSKVFVSGIFQTNVKDYDFNYIFSINPLAKNILGDNFDKSLVLQIRLKDIGNLDKFYSKFKSKLLKQYPNAQITNWKNLNQEYYNVMKFEKMLTSFILGLIILVAIFNVFASLTMTIIEKKKDISILRAMGATKNFIQKIYLYEGIFIGIIGSVFGSILGLILCYGQIYFKWFKLDSAKYIMDAIPVQINYFDVISVTLLSFLLSVFATIYPARKSGNLEIIETIREE